MPELAEVERAKNDCKLATEGKVISEILTREDKNVFQGCTHTEFADALRGKRVANVGRLGKYFYLVMQTAPHVVMHLGMAGFVSTRGQEPLFYRKKAKNWKNDDGTDWPLRYWKFALKMQDGTEWCFCDSRRFGRISLVHSGNDKSILDVEPLSLLGRDPYLDMPTLEELSAALLKRKAPIKAVLLDQNGPLCGIGNWLVDEILFQAAIHPAERSNLLTTSQLAEVHKQIKIVINKAVEVNADHSKFPSHWLFKYRWGKGRRNEPATFTLPDGTLATVIHQTVGGRTSAIVESVQKILGEVVTDIEEGSVVVENSEDEELEKDVKPAKRARAIKPKKVVVKNEETEIEKPIKRRGRKSVKAEEAEDTSIPLKVEEEAEEGKIVKITTRKRKVEAEPADGKRRQKVEVSIKPVSTRAMRASARQSQS